MGKPAIKNYIVNLVKDLRTRGYSVPEIHRELKISKSSVLRYIKGTEILPEFRSRWLERRNASKIISEKAWKNAYSESKKLVDSLNNKELMLIAAALYWAEGTKKQFNLINSDPDLIRLFIKILIDVFKIPGQSIKISLRIFENIPVEKALKFWSEVTNFELNKQTEINIVKGSKKGKLPYGMCRVRVKKGGLLLKTMFAINKQVISIISPRSSMD